MSKKLRLLKFDSAHPFSYLVSKQKQAATELESLDYEKY